MEATREPTAMGNEETKGAEEGKEEEAVEEELDVDDDVAKGVVGEASIVCWNNLFSHASANLELLHSGPSDIPLILLLLLLLLLLMFPDDEYV